MCSPYDQLYSNNLLTLRNIYSHLHIITDNKNIIKLTENVTFTYCKSNICLQKVDASKISEEMWKAIEFDRYCNYYPQTLYFPKFLTERIIEMTMSVLIKLRDDLVRLTDGNPNIFYVSEPPASAVGVYMDMFLRERGEKPFYYTSSRIFSGRCIVTQRNDGDSGAIYFSEHRDLGPKLSTSNSENLGNARTSLSHKTNRNIYQKLIRFLSGRTGAQSIYPKIFFRIFLLWRHYVHFARAFILERRQISKYSIDEVRKLFPDRLICVVFLQFEPEVSTLYWMKSVGSQIQWLKNIFENDAETIFLIREHIHFKGYRLIRHYDELVEFTNVKISKNEDMQLVIEQADQILSYSGTVGFECAKLGNFNKFRYSGQPFYSELVDEGKNELNQEKLQKYREKTMRFETDPAMNNFPTLNNKNDFICLLENLIKFVKCQ